MAIDESLGLHLHQRQQQTLTPMQLQFVRVLEMNGPEVEDEVQRALDDNPALEVADDMEHTPESEDFHESAEEMQMADYRNEDDLPPYRLEANNHSADDSYYEPIAVDRGESLMGNLLGQMSEMELSEQDMIIARQIVGNIDDNGYMTRDLLSIADDVAFQDGENVEMEDVRRVWQIVRSLDPAGIGAVDLRDCLLLQLRRLDAGDRHTAIAREIVEDYFDLFSRMHYERLAQMLNVGEEDFRGAIGVIR